MSGWIVQHIPHRRPIPNRFAGAGSLLCRVQATAYLPNRTAIPSHPGKHGLDDPCFLWDNLEARFPRSLMLAHVAIAVRSTAQDADRSDLRAMAFAPAATLQDFGSFIFGDHALDLQEQLIFWRLSHFPVEEHDLDAIFEQFFQE
jgi:hypothetical protein